MSHISRDAYPRIYELLEAERQRDGKLQYFQSLQDTESLPLRTQALKKLEESLQLLDEKSWETLKSKIIRKHGNEGRSDLRGHSALFCTINEAEGYRWLKELGMTSIYFIPDETKGRSPDLQAITVDGAIALLEVKTILESEASLKDMSTRRIKRASFECSELFQKKVIETITSARSQITSYAENQQLSNWIPHVLLVIHIDTEKQLDESAFRDNTLSWLEGLQDEFRPIRIVIANSWWSFEVGEYEIITT